MTYFMCIIHCHIDAKCSKRSQEQNIFKFYLDKAVLPSNIITLIPKRKTIVHNYIKVYSNFISIYHQVTIKSQFRHMRRQLTLISAYNHIPCFLAIEKETTVNCPAINRVKIRIVTF
jgi:hypothetical protein